MASCMQGRHQASNQSSTGLRLKNFFQAPLARSAGKSMEHSYPYRLCFGGPIWLPKLPSIFPTVFENFQAADRSISHTRRCTFPKIATGNGTILVSLPMFYAGHRWYTGCLQSVPTASRESRCGGKCSKLICTYHPQPSPSSGGEMRSHGTCATYSRARHKGRTGPFPVGMPP